MASTQVTADQVYQQVLSQGGSEDQAQVAAALVSGIESNGQLDDQNPTSTASGLFQFLTTTWASNGGSQYAATAGAANLEQQVQVFLNASKGNNFYPWAPDLGGSYDGSGTLTAPTPGSPVANMIAQNAASLGYTPINSSAGTPVTANAASATATAAPVSAPAPAQSVVVDGQTYTTPAGDANASAQTSAIAAMATTLESYGFSGPDLQTLTNWAWGEITSNTDPSQVAIDIQTPGSAAYPIFEKQFPGFTAANQQRTSQGLQAVSVSDYQGLQLGYVAAANAAGLPAGFINSNDVGTLVGGNVSSAEWTARLNDAVSVAYQSTPEQQQMLNQYFGTSYDQGWSSDQFANGQAAPTGHGPLTIGQIAALALNPTTAEPLIHQQIQAAQIGGAGVTAGLGSIDVATAQQLAQAGITTSQVTSAFQNLAPYSALETARPGAGGEAVQGVVSADQIAQGQLLGNVGAERQLQQATEVAKAPFSGGGGFTANAKGAVGTGSASSSGAGNT